MCGPDDQVLAGTFTASPARSSRAKRFNSTIKLQFQPAGPSTSGAPTAKAAAGWKTRALLKRLSAHGDAAVNRKGLAGDVGGRGVQGEILDQAGDLLDLTEAVHGNHLLNFIHHSELGCHVAVDETRGDGVDGDASRGTLLRSAHSQADDSCFCSGIIDLTWIADEADDGGDVDDSAAALLDHELGGGLGAHENSG